MAGHDFEWFLKHEDAYNSLTVDQLHALGRGELVEYGDTAPAPAAESTPPAAAESSDTPAAAQKNEPEVTPEDKDPVVLSKDGVHTIPYSELEAARARANELEALAKQQDELIKNLSKAGKEDAGSGDTQAQEDVLAEFKKQYPEIAETLAPALQKAIDAGVTVKTAELERRLNEALAPLQKSAQDLAVDSHFQTITEAVPDFETLRDSGEVEKWIEGQPSFIKNAALKVLAEGTADEVIELFNQYKASHGKQAEPTLSKEEIAAKAADAVAKAKNGAKPVSLSDVPAGQTQVSDAQPSTADEWARVFAGKSPDEIMRML